MKKMFSCPICKRPTQRDSEYFPFCCERCKTIDLGNWADGSYAIAGKDVPDSEEEQEGLLH